MAVQFSDSEREYLNDMRALTTDALGRALLVGLTEEESDFVVNYGRARIRGTHDHRDGKRYLELHDKHERARLTVIGAQIQARQDGSPRH